MTHRFDHTNPEGGALLSEMNSPSPYLIESKTQQPVYSAHTAYNPTSLAIQSSLQEIFDEFHTMITDQFKRYPFEDYDT